MSDAPVGGKAPKPGKAKGKAQLGTCHTCIPPKDIPALQSHQRRIHAKMAKVKYPDSVEDVIRRNSDSQQFHCKHCPYKNGDGQGLRRHCKMCNTVATASIPDDLDIHASGNTSTCATPELLGRTDRYRARSLDPDAEFDPIPLMDDNEDEDDENEDDDNDEEDPLQDEMDKDGEGSEDENARKPQPDAPLVNLAQIRRQRSPEDHTVVHYPTLNLTAFDIIINTLYHVVICLSCGIAVELGSMEVEHMEARVSRSWWEGALWREIQEVLAVRRGGGEWCAYGGRWE